jgi:hypothetical protein
MSWHFAGPTEEKHDIWVRTEHSWIHAQSIIAWMYVSKVSYILCMANSMPTFRNGCGSSAVISVRLTVCYVLASFSYKSVISFLFFVLLKKRNEYNNGSQPFEYTIAIYNLQWATLFAWINDNKQLQYTYDGTLATYALFYKVKISGTKEAFCTSPERRIGVHMNKNYITGHDRWPNFILTGIQLTNLFVLGVEGHNYCKTI